VIVIVIVLLVGMLCGAALADRLFHAGVTTASRRALAQLQYTLDGLEAAYSMQAARLSAQADHFQRPAADDELGQVVQLPRRD
jgi:hypothetical protein